MHQSNVVDIQTARVGSGGGGKGKGRAKRQEGLGIWIDNIENISK